MIEIDLTNYHTQWHHSHYELYLGALLHKLGFHCEIYPEDQKMAYCRDEILIFYEELLSDDGGGGMMNPVEIKVFDSEESAIEWAETASEIVLPYGLFEREELIFVREYKKMFPNTFVFESKKEAEEWIIEKELKVESITSDLEDKLSLQDFEEETEDILTKYELKKSEGNLYWVERYDIIGTGKGYVFYSKDGLENWLLHNPKIYDKYLSITYKPRKESGVYHYYKVYSYEPLLINPRDTIGSIIPLFFLLHYSFQDFTRTNDWLEYHLKKTFENNVTEYKTYVEDALIGFADRMTFDVRHLTKLKKYIENLAHKEVSTLPQNNENRPFLIQNSPNIDEIQSDLYWQGANETEFVQFAYALFYANVLRNKSEQITKFIPLLAKALNFSLGKNWDGNHSKSIKKTNNDYQPKIFEKLKDGYERYVDKIKNKKK